MTVAETTLLRHTLTQVAPLSDAAWNDVQPLFRGRMLAAGDYFAEAGEHPSELAFVVEGALRSFYRTDEGNEYNKTFFTRGTFVGALAGLIQNTETYINLQALEASRLLVTDYRTFTALYNRHHDLERIARRVIEIEWVKKEHRELRLVLCSAEERYAYFREEHPDLELRIPQYHIASYLGITPVALSRIRRRMVQDGPSERQQIPRTS